MRGSREEIRTYNYPQNRVTGHRIELTLYNLDPFVEGRITGMLQSILASDLKERLAEILNNRPRKRLGYRTPNEVYDSRPVVALQS